MLSEQNAEGGTRKHNLKILEQTQISNAFSHTQSWMGEHAISATLQKQWSQKSDFVQNKKKQGIGNCGGGNSFL